MNARLKERLKCYVFSKLSKRFERQQLIKKNEITHPLDPMYCSKPIFLIPSFDVVMNHIAIQYVNYLKSKRYALVSEKERVRLLRPPNVILSIPLMLFTPSF